MRENTRRDLMISAVPVYARLALYRYPIASVAVECTASCTDVRVQEKRGLHE
jgi:hypothetical protein